MLMSIRSLEVSFFVFHSDFKRAVHKVRHAPGGGGGVRKCDSL